MEEMIRKQDAIDALTTYIYNVYKVMTGKRMQTDKCIQAAESVLGELPTVQPNHNAEVSKMEIIRCKDCKFAQMTVDGECKYCDIWFPDEKTYMPGDYYCASAEWKGEAE